MILNILVIGAGGREHAIVRKLNRDAALREDSTTRIFAAPGNPGMEEFATLVPIEVSDVEGLAEFAKRERIDLTIVGPEVPLVAGIADRFADLGLRVFGPTQDAAQMESSKAFAKGLMMKCGVPTARYEAFRDFDEAVAYVKEHGAPIVIKADGLAAGKGVTVAKTVNEAIDALTAIMLDKEFGDSGDIVVIEQFLVGRELSVMGFVDANGFALMPGIKDHKPVGDGDEGPNTGGMGTYSPVPYGTPDVIEKVHTRIFEPVLAELRKQGIVYRGVLFAGLMIVGDDPYVIEFNARFGDPETQVAMELLQTDLIRIIDAVLEDRVSTLDIKWSDSAAVCVVLASAGYPGAYRKGQVISGLQGLDLGAQSMGEPDASSVAKSEFGFRSNSEPIPHRSSQSDSHTGSHLYALHAGTARNSDGQFVTNGGRVLGVVGSGRTLADAYHIAYLGAGIVDFEGKFYRTDIGRP